MSNVLYGEGMITFKVSNSIRYSGWYKVFIELLRLILHHLNNNFYRGFSCSKKWAYRLYLSWWNLRTLKPSIGPIAIKVSSSRLHYVLDFQGGWDSSATFAFPLLDTPFKAPITSTSISSILLQSDPFATEKIRQN